MKSTRQLIALLVVVFLLVSAHAASALNNRQQELSKTFFEAIAENICFLAHPTAPYKFSKATVSGNSVYLDITYYSEWFEVNKSMQVEIIVGENMFLQGMRVTRDEALMPAFGVVEVLKDTLLETLQEERSSQKARSQEQQSFVEYLGDYVANHVDKMSGEDICLSLLNYIWIRTDALKYMRLLADAE